MGKTEKEARLLVCLKLIGKSSKHPRHCIGSRCMAWDWTESEYEYKIFAGGGGVRKPSNWARCEPENTIPYQRSDEESWRRLRGSDRHGDCGLKASMGPEIQI